MSHFFLIHIFWFNEIEVWLNKVDKTGMSINYYLKYSCWQAARKKYVLRFMNASQFF